MRTMKRIIALITAVVLVANTGIQGIATAKDKVKTTSENLKAAQKAFDAAEEQLSIAQNNRNSLGTDADQDVIDMADQAVLEAQSNFNNAKGTRDTEIRKENEAEELGLKVYIPDKWTNTCKDWVVRDEDTEVYYKIGNSATQDWGDYTDSDAKKWTDNPDVTETSSKETYICFWAVRNEKSVSRVYFYRYDKTSPKDFNVVIKENGETAIFTCKDYLDDDNSGVDKIYYSVDTEYSTVEEIQNAAYNVELKKVPNEPKYYFEIPRANNMYNEDVFVYVLDKADNFKTDSIHVEEPHTFKLNIPSGWTNTYSDWVEASDNVDVYFMTSNENLADWGEYKSAELWSEDVVLQETGKNGAYIKFWVVKNEKVVDKDKCGPIQYFYDKTAPDGFEVETSPNGVEEYYISGKSPVTDSLSGVKKAYYSVNTEYHSLTELEDETKAGPVDLTFNEDANGYDLRVDYDPSMAGYTVYIYVVDEAGNIRTSSVSVEEHYVTHFDVGEIIDFDAGWNNSYKDWVQASKDIKVYFRIRSNPHTDSQLGDYTHRDVKEWGADISETTSGKYISFWAVKDGNVYEKTGQYHYRLDMTPPSGFSIAIEEDNTDLYRLVSVGNNALTDSRSGVAGAFYTIGKEYDPLNNGDQKIVKIEVKESTENPSRGKFFDFHCTQEMTGQTVYVYVVDAAGNMTSSSIYVENAINTKSPSLNVTGINADEWIKFETRQQQWKVSTDNGAKVYYKISKTDLGKNWGKYTDVYEEDVDKVREWTNDDNFINGELYIHFWAVYPGSEVRIPTEQTYQFKYDNTAPSISEAKVEIVPGVAGKNNASLKISCSGISDNESGIDKKSIKYVIAEKSDNSIEKRKGTLSEADLKIDEDGSIGFSIDLTEGEEIELGDAKVIFSDLAGNKVEHSLGQEIIFNKNIPVVSLNKGDLGIVEKEEANAEIIQPYSFYAADNTSWKSVYINGDEYLKIKAKDTDLWKIVLTIVGDKSHTVEFGGTSAFKNQWKRVRAPWGSNEPDTFYLSVSKFADILTKNDINYIRIEVKDRSNNTCPVTFICDGTTEECTLFYDPDDDNEPAIDHSRCDSFYGMNAGEQEVAFQITEDNGLKSISVLVNGNKVDFIDLTKGKPDIPQVEEVTEAEAGTEAEPASGEAVAADVQPENDRFIPYVEYPYTINFSDKKFPFLKNGIPVDGHYDITVIVEDLAGNQNQSLLSFTIDTEAPRIESAEYYYDESPINGLPMGLFGKENYKIRVKATDPNPEEGRDGSGVSSVYITWAGGTFEGQYDSDTETYAFEPLPIDTKDVLAITLVDYMENEVTFALVSVDDKDEDEDHYIGMNFGAMKGAPVLFLENTIPNVIIILPDEFKTEEDETDTLAIYEFLFEDEHIERWYPGDIDLKVAAQDGESGLMIVRINRDGEVFYEETSCLDAIFVQDIFNELAEYSYSLTEEGSYYLLAYAIDNALNSNESEPAEEQTTIFHIDKTKPQITEFRFGNDSGNGDSVEHTNYGFFFTEDTELRIYVKDPGVSSGLNSVTLYLKDINGETIELTKTAEELIVEEVDPIENKNEEDKPGTETSDEDEQNKDDSDTNDQNDSDKEDGQDQEGVNDGQNGGSNEDGQNGGSDDDEQNGGSNDDDQNDDDQNDEEEETERYYMSFIIEKGFKGGVSAIVTDNVGHSSGLINADGSIIENQEIHANTSGITITEKDPSRKTDANGIPLYKNQVVLTVTVEDTFSGIDHIDWSIAKDRTSGTISVDLEGKATSDSPEAVIIEDSIEYDQNLVTKIQFQIVVKSNANGNAVKINMTDRAGNTSEKENVYSIDTTAPVIIATLGDGAPRNGYYYNAGRTVTITITERNFNPSDVIVRLNTMTPNVHWDERGASITTDETAHVGTFTVTEDGDYYFSVSYADIAGNNGDTYSSPRFVIDKTSPKVSNNFESFGALDDEEIYYNSAQKNTVKAEITVKEVNFYAEDVHLQVYYQPAGSKHTDKDAEWKSYYYSANWEDSGSDIHKLTIPFTEDGVYKITIAPVDRAGNAADLTNGAGGQYPTKSAIFETDYIAPVIAARNGNSVTPDNYTFCDVYDYDRRNDEAPAVSFEDINIAYIVCNGKKYTPVYTNGREIGLITPEEINGRSEERVADTYVPTMVYKLDGFELDGVYSLKITAYDKAGNASILNDSTYVRMVDPTVKVLAYIENSDRDKATGWYSFEDENGPISKRPNSFSDLSIVVFSKLSDSTQICLVDKATQEVTDTKVTGSEESLFDRDMYDVGAYRYILPGEYFVKNFTADADTGIYLRIVNNGQSLDLGEMNIDNTTPNCTIPEHFHDWGWFSGSGEHVIEFTDLSETLEISETVAYVDGETIHLANLSGYEDSPFVYDEASKKLSLTLQPGSHKVGLLLVDRAGNTKSIKEVQHLAIGDYRVWIGIGSGFGVILLAVLAVIFAKMMKKKKQMV